MKLKTLLLAAVMLSPSVALASPDCTAEPKDKWISEEAMNAKIGEFGYKADELEVSGSCYEIYGFNKDGKKVEVYFNPVTGEVVEEEIEG